MLEYLPVSLRVQRLIEQIAPDKEILLLVRKTCIYKSD